MDEPPATTPVVPPGYALVRTTNWWLVSGIFIALGAVIIGIAFIILAAAYASSTYSLSYTEAFYTCLGVGIMLIGTSFVFARIPPRVS